MLYHSLISTSKSNSGGMLGCLLLCRRVSKPNLRSFESNFFLNCFGGPHSKQTGTKKAKNTHTRRKLCKRLFRYLTVGSGHNNLLYNLNIAQQENTVPITHYQLSIYTQISSLFNSSTKLWDSQSLLVAKFMSICTKLPRSCPNLKCFGQ